jgi:hypothetical protein
MISGAVSFSSLIGRFLHHWRHFVDIKCFNNAADSEDSWLFSVSCYVTGVLYFVNGTCKNFLSCSIFDKGILDVLKPSLLSTELGRVLISTMLFMFFSWTVLDTSVEPIVMGNGHCFHELKAFRHCSKVVNF